MLNDEDISHPRAGYSLDQGTSNRFQAVYFPPGPRLSDAELEAYGRAALKKLPVTTKDHAKEGSEDVKLQRYMLQLICHIVGVKSAMEDISRV